MVRWMIKNLCEMNVVFARTLNSRPKNLLLCVPVKNKNPKINRQRKVLNISRVSDFTMVRHKKSFYTIIKSLAKWHHRIMKNNGKSLKHKKGLK